MDRLLSTYVYTHIHIALCAVVLCVGGIALGDIDDLILPSSFYLGGHAFCATLFVYSLHRWLGSHKIPTHGNNNRYLYSKSHSSLIIMMTICGLIGAVCTLLLLSLPRQILLVISGIISTAYMLPILWHRRLRDYGILKVVLIGSAWAAMPVIGALPYMFSSQLVLLFLENLFFIIALTIPFEWRDLEMDQQAAAGNIFSNFSRNKMENAIYSLIVASMILSAISAWENVYTWPMILILCIFYLLQIFLTTGDRLAQRSEMFYLFWLDGLILLKGLIYVWGSTLVMSGY